MLYPQIESEPFDRGHFYFFSGAYKKFYVIYTIPSTGLDLDAAFHFCQQLSPAGKLVLPVDAESNDVVHGLAK